METEVFPEIYGLIAAMSVFTLTLYLRLGAVEILGFRRVVNIQNCLSMWIQISKKQPVLVTQEIKKGGQD